MLVPVILDSLVGARLGPRFDPTALQADWAGLAGLADARQLGPHHDGSWRGLALRSLDGSPLQLDAGTLRRRDFVDTPLVREAPHLRAALAAIPGRHRAARLMTLPPGARIQPHVDTDLDLGAGVVRLHLPIHTHEDVQFFIGGIRCGFGEGELWYGDFSRTHHVLNASPITRVHLVLDAELDPALAACFPEGFLRQLRRIHARRLPWSRRLARAAGALRP